MLAGDDIPPQISVAVGVVVGLLASFVQSLGLTIQRKSHLQNEALPLALRKRDYKRPLWVTGFTIFICSNLLGTIFQIGALPIVVLGPLGAVSLLYNAFFARVILGDEFTTHLIAGTVLIAGGAVLIGIFGVVPEQTHTLEELVRLYSRPAFIIWISLLSFSLVVLLLLAHLTEFAMNRRLHADQPSTPVPRDRRVSSMWRKARPPPLGHAHSSPVPDYGAFESLPTSARASGTSLSAGGGEAAEAVEGGTKRVTGTVRQEEEAEVKALVSAAAVERTRLVVGVAYGSGSGTLSGLCLLFAKTGIELLILTVVGKNQFGQYQAWMIVLVLVIAAILQLIYLNRALRLVGPTLICPLAFCFYNLSSMISGLIYYDQWDMLSPLQIGLVSLGTAILLAGVWIVSIRPDKKEEEHQHNHRRASRGHFTDGPVTDEPTSETSDSETESCVEPAGVDWLPRGLTIGIGAASPGFEIRPAHHHRRHIRTATLPNHPFPSLLQDDSDHHDAPPNASAQPLSRTVSDGDVDPVGDAAGRRKRFRTRGTSLSGSLFVGRRIGDSVSAPSSPLATPQREEFVADSDGQQAASGESSASKKRNRRD